METNNTTLNHHPLLHNIPYPTHKKPILTSSLVNSSEGHEGSIYLPFYYSQLHLPNSNPPIHFIDNKTSPNTSSNSNNNNNINNNLNDCVGDLAAKDDVVVVDDKKKKRMFSNRESARRSRMRKKQQIENLQYQVDHLQDMNHQLSQKIIYLLECNQQIIQQNGQLKDKVSSLQGAISDLLLPLSHHHHHHQNIPINGLFTQPSSAPPVTSSGA
ncbi:basic leucine zipper 43 [Senna tora]|uniref:Basic leucine zipper 43 n=1 Tax=Senna tora TaxID=362788 RepID=A0A834X635_9FABA|nr:basic leucine zipper 43 [Senna tora]